MDVADWLRKLRLEHYKPAFRADEIDESPTADDLKYLAITLVGHRLSLLDAAALDAKPSAATVSATSSNIHKMLFVSVTPYCCSSSSKLYVPSKKHNAVIAKFGQLTVTRA
jgi:hypothetical protein